MPEEVNAQYAFWQNQSISFIVTGRGLLSLLNNIGYKKIKMSTSRKVGLLLSTVF